MWLRSWLICVSCINIGIDIYCQPINIIIIVSHILRPIFLILYQQYLAHIVYHQIYKIYRHLWSSCFHLHMPFRHCLPFGQSLTPFAPVFPVHMYILYNWPRTFLHRYSRTSLTSLTMYSQLEIHQLQIIICFKY